MINNTTLKFKAGNFTENLTIKVGELLTQSMGATISELMEFDGLSVDFRNVVRDATSMITEIKKNHKDELKPKNADQKKAFIVNKLWADFDNRKANYIPAPNSNEADVNELQRLSDMDVFKTSYAHSLAYDGMKDLQLKKVEGATLTYAVKEDSENQTKEVTLFVRKFTKTLTVEVESMPKKIGTWIFTENPDFVAPEGVNVVRKSFVIDNNTFDTLRNTDEKLYNLCVKSLVGISEARKVSRNSSLVDITTKMSEDVKNQGKEVEKSLAELQETLRYFGA